MITNAVNIAAELAGTDVEVILTGGVLRRNSFSLVGPLAEDSLRHVTADLLFLAVDGFDVDYGLTTPNLLEARANRVMMENAKTDHHRLRFQQVRPPQPFFHCANFGGSSHDHRQENCRQTPASAASCRHQSDDGLTIFMDLNREASW